MVYSITLNKQNDARVMKLSICDNMSWSDISDLKIQSTHVASILTSSIAGVHYHRVNNNNDQHQSHSISSTYSHVFATNGTCLWRICALNVDGTDDWNIVQLQLPFNDGLFLNF
jgi:hypothetical protein